MYLSSYPTLISKLSQQCIISLQQILQYLKNAIERFQPCQVSRAIRADHVDKHPFLQEPIRYAETKVMALTVLSYGHLQTQRNVTVTQRTTGQHIFMIM